MKKYLLASLLFLTSCTSFAASVSTAINANTYTSIPENSGSGFTVTPFQPAQCTFSSSQPSISVVGHRVAQGEVWAINSTGSALWCKNDTTVTGNNFITTTISADASINGSGSTGGGGGGGDVNLNQVGGVSFTLGQKTKSGSLPITLASDQGGIPVTGTFWQATQPVSAASLPLPAGASTSALQITGNTALTTINTTLGSPMQNSGGTVTANAGTGIFDVNCVTGCSGGGGGGSAIQGFPLTDDDEVLFVSRDNGATPPVFSYYLLQDGSAYTPNGEIKPRIFTLSTVYGPNGNPIPQSIGTSANALRVVLGNQEPVLSVNVAQGGYTYGDYSGTITSGGTAQNITNGGGQSLLKIQNLDATEDLWLNETGSVAAISAAGSFKITAGSFYVTDSNATISIIATTTGHKFTVTTR